MTSSQTMESLQSFGSLYKLPKELRLMIWKNLIPGPENKDGLKFLQTSRAIYSEASYEIYRKQMITFHLSPIYQRNSWITVSTSGGLICTPKSEHDAISLGFQTLPYHKFTSIKIEIVAPSSNGLDNGQFILLMQKLFELTTVLTLSREKLKAIDFHFLPSSSEDSKWIPEGLPGATNNQEGNENPNTEFAKRPSSLAFIIGPLLKLRNLPDFRIFVPKRNPELPGTEEEVSKERQWLVKQDPDLKFHRFWTQRFDNIDKIDKKLDTTPGPTAHMLRLERFANWFDDGESIHGKSSYMDRLERRCRRPGGVANVADAKWGWRCMVALNPLSERMQEYRDTAELNIDKTRLTVSDIALTWGIYPTSPARVIDWNWYFYHRSLIDADNKFKNSLTEAQRFTLFGLTRSRRFQEGWDKEEWFKFYPQGIPELDQSLVFFEIRMGYDAQDQTRTSLGCCFADWDNYSTCTSWQRRYHNECTYLRYLQRL